MFYDKFKKLCDDNGTTCNKVALEIGLSNATPTTWKKRGLTPRYETLQKIAEYFHVSIEYLINSGDEERTSSEPGAHVAEEKLSVETKKLPPPDSDGEAAKWKREILENLDTLPTDALASLAGQIAIIKSHREG